MKKIVAATICIFLLSQCSVFKKEKYGCPSDGRNVGAEKLASGDPKAVRASQKAKFRGTQSY